MNYIENLLQGQKVERKPLGEVCEIRTGQGINKRMILDNAGEHPVINSGREPLGFINKWNTEDDPIGITSRGAGVGSITWQEGKYFRGNLNYSVTHDKNEINTRFLYHLLLEFQREIQSLCTFDGIPALNTSNLKSLQIPIPPLAVQKEIAKILDTFTMLEAELEAELDCRKRQYHHYRDTLLTFGDDVEWKTLGEITIYTQNIKWKENSDTYCYIDLTSVNLEGNTIIATKEINYETAPSRAQKIVERDDVIFATTRPTQMRIALINNDYHGQIASTGYCVLRANQNQVLPKWIYFCLTTMDFKNYLEENQSGSAYPAISDGKLKEYKIPLPPIEEQKRIAEILDKFDRLVNDISEGLPAEIIARRKQYEYYREKLLSFPEN